MHEKDIAWDYTAYALNSIPYNLCVIGSIAAGCGCSAFLKRNSVAKWIGLVVIVAAMVSLYLVVRRHPSFTLYVWRDLVTVFAVGYVGRFMYDVVRQSRTKNNGRLP